MYAPGVTDQRGTLMLEGLLENGRQSSRAASSAAQWLGNFLDQQKQITNAGKSADYFVKANPDALNHMGIHEDEWANLGARDKALAVQGYTQATTAQQIASENQARTELQLSQANRLNQTTQLTEEESQALPVLMQNLDQLNQANPGRPGTPAIPATTAPLPPGLRMLPGEGAGQVPPGLGGEMPPLPGGIAVPGVPGTAGTPPMMTPAMAAMVRAAAQMGATNPKFAASIARQVLPKLLEGGTDTQGMSFEEDPVSGFRFATKGKIVQPSGVNPTKVAPQMIPQHDDDGNLIGYSEVDAKGHSRFTPAKGPKMQPAVDAATDQAIPGFYVDPQGKLHDTRSALQKITGAAPAGTNATAGAKAAPAAKAKEAQGGYKVGNVYGGLRYLGGDPNDKANWQNR